MTVIGIRLESGDAGEPAGRVAAGRPGQAQAYGSWVSRWAL
jgi:hypothetical protein